MTKTSLAFLLCAAALSSMVMASPAAAAAKCTSLQARCAMQIGGRCDPVTGRWFYGSHGNQRAGGNAQSFNACISQGGKK